MRWAYPGTLWALLLLLPLILISLFTWLRARRELPVFFGGPRGKADLTAWVVRMFFKDLFLAVFFVFVLLAAAEPRRGRAPVPGEERGLDAALVIDVSRSMMAEDIAPSRLAKAVSTVRLLHRSLKDSRFALIPFKGDAAIVVPMTEDRTILDAWFDRLSPGVSTIPGTNLEAALQKGREAFPAGSGRHKVLILFTDGESLSGRVGKVAREFAMEGITVHVVAAGSSQGVPIRLSDGTFVQDRKGMVVMSKVDTEGLEWLAEETHGSFTDLSRTGALAALINELEEEQHLIERKGIQLRPVNRYRYFLLPGLFFLLASFFIRMIPWERKP